MDYFVSCPCGQQIRVTATQAGSDVTCACGRSVLVPALSQLRQAAGKGAYESGTIDAIHRILAAGELPWGQLCAVCGRPTPDGIEVTVQCERKWSTGPGFGSFLFRWLMIFFLPFWYILLRKDRLIEDEPRRQFGRDRVVRVPLRACREHHAKLHRTRSQHQLRKLLATVPVCAKLLEEYPAARIRA